MPNSPATIGRVAVLSDIHGNLPALEAVLADVARAGVDLIVLNGDHAGGPLPVQTLDRLIGLGDRALWIGGNGDRAIVERFDGVVTPDADPVDRWAATRITRAHRDRLATLPMTATVDVRGVGPVGFCHATPRGDDDLLLVDSSIDAFRQAFAALADPTVVIGHTHMPFDRLFDRRRIVNAGSVGIPYGHTGASWALVGPDVVLRRTTYDVEAAAERLARSDMPDVQRFIDEHVRAAPGDADALVALRAQRKQRVPSMSIAPMSNR